MGCLAAPIATYSMEILLIEEIRWLFEDLQNMLMYLQGCEVVLLLCTMKLVAPEAIYMNRGNHEDDAMNSLTGTG